MIALIVTVLGLLTGSLAQSVGEADKQKWKEVSNPCLHYKCPAESECVPVANDLLQLPVPLCVLRGQPELAGDQCSSREVGVSILSCRTQQQWMTIATSSCGPHTASVEVRHPCHRRKSGSPSIFLQATISCCPPTVAPETPPTSTETTPTIHAYDVVSSSPENAQAQGDEEGYGVSVVVIVTLGCVMVLAVILIGVVKILCRQRKRAAPYKPRVSFVTSYVNLSSDGWGEGGGKVTQGKPDFSYVVANDNHFSDTG